MLRLVRNGDYPWLWASRSDILLASGYSYRKRYLGI